MNAPPPPIDSLAVESSAAPTLPRQASMVMVSAGLGRCQGSRPSLGGSLGGTRRAVLGAALPIDLHLTARGHLDTVPRPLKFTGSYEMPLDRNPALCELTAHRVARGSGGRWRSGLARARPAPHQRAS